MWKANKENTHPIVTTEILYNNLNEKNKEFFKKTLLEDFYHGNIVDISMNDWLKNEKDKDAAKNKTTW
ncbi:hypothetical protein [Bacillus cereus]|uniref:hypothetical protein n=1 Tax=Bacillus cereus TaxID=1396 RepID=UPI001C3EEC94|nr:hypothetical protein [Bacillus cereus]